MPDSKKIFPLLLVAIPGGTVILGVFSMIVYFQKGSVSAGPAPPPGMMQKAIAKEDLEKYVRVLTEDIGDRNTANPKNLAIAANYLEGTLGKQNMGYAVRRQTFEVDGISCDNLEVEIEGKGKAKEIVVVGAHYDSVPGTVGANDNGSGVAALLSLANVFVDSKNARTLRFVAFVNEEPPFFQTENMGSMQYVKQCKARGDKIVAMICLETIGYFSDEPGSQHYPEGLAESYPDTGNFIAVVSNESSSGLLRDFVGAFRSGTNLPCEQGVFPPHLPGVAWSDHWSFWQAGYPAVMITDTAPFRYPHYHEPSDTADKLDYDRFFEVVRGVQAAIRGLVNPSPPD